MFKLIIKPYPTLRIKKKKVNYHMFLEIPILKIYAF